GVKQVKPQQGCTSSRNSPFTRSEAQHALDSSAFKVWPLLSGRKFAVRMRNH
ncbi:MAG: hypothetical protein ACI87Q_002388, partial [Pseudohongiellaceae bacterium]